jgi:hypothetical protein
VGGAVSGDQSPTAVSDSPIAIARIFEMSDFSISRCYPDTYIDVVPYSSSAIVTDISSHNPSTMCEDM